MRVYKRSLTIATALAGLMGFASTGIAAPLVFSFDTGANVNLGGTHVYSTPTPGLTAIGGSYTGSTVSLSEDLFSNDRGSDEQGLGICSSQIGNSNNCRDSTEINGTELVQLDLQALNSAGYNTYSINADSATSGEFLSIYVSNVSGQLGTLAASITSAQGDQPIATGGGRFLNFTTSNAGNGSDVILHSLTADKLTAVPEPATAALLGLGLFGLGLFRRRTRA